MLTAYMELVDLVNLLFMPSMAVSTNAVSGLSTQRLPQPCQIGTQERMSSARHSAIFTMVSVKHGCCQLCLRKLSTLSGVATSTLVYMKITYCTTILIHWLTAYGRSTFGRKLSLERKQWHSMNTIAFFF